LSAMAGSRWLSWIGQHELRREEALQYGLSARNLRLIHSRDTDDTLWAFWEALNNGTSAYVVATLPLPTSRLDARHMDYLNQAALNGECRGLLITSTN